MFGQEVDRESRALVLQALAVHLASDEKLLTTQRASGLHFYSQMALALHFAADQNQLMDSQLVIPSGEPINCEGACIVLSYWFAAQLIQLLCRRSLIDD